MKHSEFKRKVEELGFRIETNKFGVSIVHDKYKRIAIIDEKYAFRLDTTFQLMSMQTGLTGNKLFDILVEYAKTPIQERKNGKKYVVYPMRTNNKRLIRYDNTFRVFGYEDEDSFAMDNSLFVEDTTIFFPESEAKEICDYFGWDFNKVAVEVDDDE